VISYGQDHRDSGLAGLCVEGEMYSDFWERKKLIIRTRNVQKEISSKGIKGFHIEYLKNWAESFLDEHEGPGIMMFDQLSGYLNKDFRNSLESRNWKTFLILLRSAKKIYVYDRSFFSVIKSHLLNKETKTTEQKRAAFFELCQGFEPSLVERYCAHNG
jgi:hypothetical protein